MNELTRIVRAQADVSEHGPARSGEGNVSRAPVDYRARFTIAEFERMCASGALDDMKVELVDGELERMQLPNNLHAMRQAKVMFGLTQALDVERVRGSVGIDLGSNTLLECDAAVLRQLVIADRRLFATDILLAVEIAESTRARDLGMKRIKYAAAGIPHYWVVDGERGVVHAHAEPIAGDYAEINTVRFGQPLPVPGTDVAIVVE